MIVIDASALVEVLLRTAAALTVEARIHEEPETLHAPHLIDVEISHVVRRIVLRNEIDIARGELALEALAEYPVNRYPHLALLPRIWELRHNLSACDAAYVALAEVLNAPLVTRDRRLAASSGHRARIELL